MLETNKQVLPDLSVIVCCFNHATWIERCIRSILNQELIDNDDFEIILVDDKSSDTSVEVIENLLPIRNLNFIKNPENIGLPSSLNKALKIARGRYVVRVDSDDYVSRKFLYFLKFFLDKNRHYQAVSCDYYTVDEFENITAQISAIEQEIACATMFRKECLHEIGLYNEDFKMREGHELKKRFQQRFSVGYLELPLYKYRKHFSNRTKKSDDLKIYDSMLKDREGK